MTFLGVLFLLLVIAVPVGWFASEFQARRWLRMVLGISAILLSTTTACIATIVVQRFNYNAWYGKASNDLLDVSITEIEKGNTEKVVREWTSLRERFQFTYENRAHYDDLVSESVARLKSPQ